MSGKLIVIILIVASVFAWSVMVTKYLDLTRAKRASRRFQLAFRNEAHPLSLYLKRHAFAESPIYKVYEAGCHALGGELNDGRHAGADLFSAGSRLDDYRLNHLQVEVVRRVTERTVADQALEMESKMGFLATAVSASPLLGLLGTVWGVLDAFGAMAVSGAANLSAVAPGISAALLTTVVGLLVALPSSIGYNILASQIREIAVQMDNFAQEFVAELQRMFVRE
ncbi:MAG TPA: MotA/TolQ/ExbB proton channel family protein [Kiritimatiellia bacterium]|nr:MotA/TolQ/ExbB proton channel family protein [Kiritimatiellia bacterium]HSA17210.1 MotA/TolQ/ExbB proton channel family protein [Kiritimatiellia bacterium]